MHDMTTRLTLHQAGLRLDVVCDKRGEIRKTRCRKADFMMKARMQAVRMAIGLDRLRLPPSPIDNGLSVQVGWALG